MSDTRAALEAALAAFPRDPARHAAYADLLIEQGDPRGEYIRLQLALEDRDQPADRLRALEQQAFDLRRQHEADWLGPLFPFVEAARGPSVGAMVAEPLTVTWRRGWVHSVEVHWLSRPVAAALAVCPAARLLSRLTVRTADRNDRPLLTLTGAWWIDALRSLMFGRIVPNDLVGGDTDISRLVRHTRRLRRLVYRDTVLGEAAPVFARMPRLTALRVETLGRIPVGILARTPMNIPGYSKRLGRLRTLVLDNSQPVDDPGFPRGRINEADELRMLFEANMPELRHLSLHLRSFGDAGVEELLRSGLLRRLEMLDLGRCDITDDGAEQLAASPEVRNLRRVRLTDNHLSAIGVQALRAVGIRAGRQGFDFGAGDEDV